MRRKFIRVGHFDLEHFFPEFSAPGFRDARPSYKFDFGLLVVPIVFHRLIVFAESDDVNAFASKDLANKHLRLWNLELEVCRNQLGQ